MTLSEFSSHFKGVKGSGNQYAAICPAHDDQRQSLSMSTGADGRIILNCHAGCKAEDIVWAAGLQMKDLFAEQPKRERQLVATYDYTDEAGILVHQKLRYDDKTFSQRRPNGKGGWLWSLKGVTPVLYNLPAVQAASVVYVVEGEKDCETLRKHGKTATCGTHGAGPGKWLSHYNGYFTGKSVIIIQDNDDVGKAFAIETANNLHGVANSLKLIDLTVKYPSLPEHGDISDVLALMSTKGMSEVEQLIADTPEYQPRDPKSAAVEWPQPIPFETINTPDFPTESLPGPVAAFVEALAESTQTPDEMAAVLSLGILSAAFQSRYEVEITPDWIEPLCLYSVAIAPPGERKSAVISALAGPMYEYESTRREFEAVDIAQNQLEKRMLEKALANAEAAATKAHTSGKKKGNAIEWDAAIGDSQSQARQNALDIAEQLATFKEKHPFRLLVDDTTPEKLVDIMDMQGGCITVASAEGGVFDSLAGRYDRSANFDVYLKGHAGDPITVDRIGRKPNHIKRPRLTMMLTIQPEVLTGLMANATFRGRGLCGRFLYAVCKSKVGRRNVNPDDVPQQTKDEYRQFVRRILSGYEAGVIHLSAEAHKLRLDYAAYVEKRLGGELEHMRDWGGKLVGAMLRIAAIIHAAEVQGSPVDTPISPEVITAAVKIAECLSVHAMAAYQVMGADETYEDAKYLLRRIESTGQDHITKRDLFDICKGKFKKVDAMEPALQTLVDMGYIRESEISTGGRPSKKIIVNPLRKSSKSSKSI